MLATTATITRDERALLAYLATPAGSRGTRPSLYPLHDLAARGLVRFGRPATDGTGRRSLAVTDRGHAALR